MAEGSGKAREIDLGENFGDVVVKANGARMEVGAGGHVAVSAPDWVELLPVPANDSASKVTHELGVRETDGPHKGEIYGGIYPADNEPIWFSEEPKPMSHYEAVELKGRALPTSEQGKYQIGRAHV